MLRTPLRFALALIALSTAACTTPAEVSEECINTADCAEGLRCMMHLGADPDRVCMSECELATTRLCATGEVCTRIDTDPAIGVCYLGGTTAVGADCTLNADCVAGAICVIRSDVTPAIQQCFRACEVDEPSACEASETCLPLMAAGNDGYCQPSS